MTAIDAAFTLGGRDRAEDALIGAVLLDEHILDVIAEQGVTPGCLRKPGRRRALEAMLELQDAGERVDEVTVRDRLEKRGHPDAERLVADLASTPIPSLASIADYAEIVRREHEWDQRHATAVRAVDAASQRDEDAWATALADAENADRDGADGDHIHTPEALATEFFDWLEDNRPPGIPTGMPALDELLAGGFRTGDVTVLAAWSGVGKSLWVDQALTHAAKRGHRVALYMNEMSREDRVARSLAAHSGVPFARIIRKDLTVEQQAAVIRALDSGGGIPFTVVSCSGWSAEQIARHVRRHKWDLAAVDLVSNIPARDTADWDHVSGALARCARQTGCHLLLVSQLNRERDKGAKRPPPVKRDLRGTGAWEHDSRAILLLHREEEVVEAGDGAGVARTLADGHIRVAKATNGREGVVPVRFDERRMRFVPTDLTAERRGW